MRTPSVHSEPGSNPVYPTCFYRGARSEPWAALYRILICRLFYSTQVLDPLRLELFCNVRPEDLLHFLLLRAPLRKGLSYGPLRVCVQKLLFS